MPQHLPRKRISCSNAAPAGFYSDPAQFCLNNAVLITFRPFPKNIRIVL